jgi:hypothetical protein
MIALHQHDTGYGFLPDTEGRHTNPTIISFRSRLIMKMPKRHRTILRIDQKTGWMAGACDWPLGLHFEDGPHNNDGLGKNRILVDR